MAMKIKLKKADIRGVIFAIGLLCAILVYSGCNEQSGRKGDSSSTPTPTPTPTPTATPTATASATPSATPTPTPTPAATTEQYFSVALSFPVTTIFAPFHAYNSTTPADWSEQCRVNVTPTDNTSKDIYCIGEVGQLDLWDNNFSLTWTAPVANCSYVIESPYWFSQWRAGKGPAYVRYKTDAASLPFDLECSYDGGVTYTGCVDARIVDTGTSSTVACSYDYSKSLPLAGPNCCEGYYTESVTADGAASPTVTRASWGGQWGNCAAGAAAWQTDLPKDPVHKMPWGLVTMAYGGGTGTRVIKSPQSRLNYGVTSVANYHPLLLPPATPTPTPTPAPTPGMNPIAPLTAEVSEGGASYPMGNPYYEYGCYDAAYRLMGRIRILIRKWNLQSELNSNTVADPGDWTATLPNATPFPMPWRTLYSWEELFANPSTPTPTPAPPTAPTPARFQGVWPDWYL